jgi:hypothetical protein
VTNKILSSSIYLLIPLASISGLMRLPIVINKIQPFELVFIGLFILFIDHLLSGGLAFTRLPFLLFFNPIDKVLTFLIFLTLVNLLAHPSFAVFLECLANAYVIAIYFFFSRLTFLQKGVQIWQNGWLFMVIIAIISGLLGNFWYYYSGSEQFVTVYKNSPYLGSIFRMKGFSASSNSLASILAFGFFMVFPFLKGYKKIIFLCAVIAISQATQSKEAYFFLAVFVFQMVLKYLGQQINIARLKIWSILMYIGLFTLSIVSIFWVFCFGAANCNASVAGLGHAFTITENIKASPSGYFYLFDVAIRHIQQSPFWGIGLGNFSDSITAFKQAGVYPSNIANYEAHDLYWGMVAQMGVGYIIFLAVFIQVIYQTLQQLWQNETSAKSLVWAFWAIFLFIGLDSLGNVGAFHFRHYWIFLGIYSGFYSKIATPQYFAK